MKDIDFDELDRAVSSLMGSVPKDAPAKAADAPAAIPNDDNDGTVTPTAHEPEPVEAHDAADDVAPTPEATPSAAPDSPPEPAEDKAPEQSPSTSTAMPPVASRGRFMDVVRPGRDMSMRRSPQPARRQGVTIQPSTTERPPVGTPAERPSDDNKTDPALQTALMRDLEDTASTPTAGAAPEVTDNPSPEADDDNAPLNSPFLPDAKVEKRPLGRPTEAASATESANEPAEKVDSSMESLPTVKQPENAPQEVDAQLPEEPLPAELDSKLLSIETDTTTQHSPETAFPQTPSPEQPAAATATDNGTAGEHSSATDVSRAMAAASIPQQYKLKAEPGEDVPAGAIYDTRPLAHPAKSTPGWVWLIAIIGILIVGAALGAGVYYLGLL